MLILNAFLLNKNFGLQKGLSQTEYRYIVASSLLNYTPIPPAPRAIAADGQDNNNDPVQNGPIGHWPERLPVSATAKKARTKVRKCAYCFVSAKQAARGVGQRKEASTTIICSECRVPLCIFPCFGKYHQEKNYQ